MFRIPYTFAFLVLSTSPCASISEDCKTGLCGNEDDEFLAMLQTKLVVQDKTAEKQHASLQISEHSTVGGCRVHGSFRDAHGKAKFRIDDTFIELSIDGSPTVLQVFDNHTKASKVTIGNVTTRLRDALPQQYIHHANALAASTFAAKSSRAFSRLLHSHGYDGGSATCTYPFHMLMLNLHMASQNGYGVTELLRAKSQHDETKWGPYGFDAECPATGDRSWKCRKEWGFRRRWGSNGAWVTDDSDYLAKTGRRRRFNRRRRVVDSSDPLEETGGDVKCNGGECIGLCGAGCDCWESLCGDNYRCNYNPMCCAHDKACDKYGYLSIKCLDISTAYNACDNDQLATYDGR